MDSGGNETLNFLEGGGNIVVVVADVDDSAGVWVGGVRENEEAVGKYLLFMIILVPIFGKQIFDSLPPVSYS